MKKVLVLLLMAISLNSCGEGCDCCLGDPCWDAQFENLGDVGGGFGSIDLTQEELDRIQEQADSIAKIATYSLFTIADICDVAAGAIFEDYSISCEQLKELDYINNPPTECDTITLVDYNGNSWTGVYINHVLNQNCN